MVNNKENGVFYTPSDLANFLTSPLINRNNLTIFDPSFGEGALLNAALETSTKNNFENQYFGCDIKSTDNNPHNFNLFETSFFNFKLDKKFDLILMNPPFIRHHLLSQNLKNELWIEFTDHISFSKNSDIWCYFLLKSITHLKKNGSIGAILPWSFIQADYSKIIRENLTEQFGEIRILCLRKKYFKNTNERVLLVWLNNYGMKCKKIEIGVSYDINKKIKYNKYSLDEWKTNDKIFNDSLEINKLLNKFKSEYSFEEFRNYADIKIGIVTGADKFFILNSEEIGIENLIVKKSIPIIKSSKEISGLFFNGYIPNKKLIILNKEFNQKYIEKGEEKEFNKREHSIRRNPWFIPKLGKIPDAFFPYRIDEYPFLVINDSKKLQSTNSVHRIYFNKNITDNMKRWIQISQLSYVAQLSLEINSKIYGNGVLKIEPKSLYSSLVYKGNTKLSKSIYSDINFLLINSKKLKAIELASEFIFDKLEVSDNLANSSKKYFEKMRNCRKGKLT